MNKNNENNEIVETNEKLEIEVLEAEKNAKTFHFKNMIGGFSLNENQFEYAKKANKKFNIKSFGLFSGAHFVDMNVMIPERIKELKQEKGIFLLIFPNKRIAKNRLRQGGLDTNKPMFSHNGQTFYVQIATSNPKKLQKILTKKVKYFYVDHMETLSKATFDVIMEKAKEEKVVLDGTIGGTDVKKWLGDFLNNEENLYYQEDFTTENNTLFPGKEKKYIIENFSKEVTQGFKLGIYNKNKEEKEPE